MLQDADEGEVEVDKSSSRYQACADTVVRMMTETRGDDEVRVEDLIGRLNDERSSGSGAFSRAEVGSILRDLERDNRVMYRNGLIHQI